MKTLTVEFTIPVPDEVYHGLKELKTDLEKDIFLAHAKREILNDLKKLMEDNVTITKFNLE